MHALPYDHLHELRVSQFNDRVRLAGRCGVFEATIRGHDRLRHHERAVHREIRIKLICIEHTVEAVFIRRRRA